MKNTCATCNNRGMCACDIPDCPAFDPKQKAAFRGLCLLVRDIAKKILSITKWLIFGNPRRRQTDIQYRMASFVIITAIIAALLLAIFCGAINHYQTSKEYAKVKK